MGVAALGLLASTAVFAAIELPADKTALIELVAKDDKSPDMTPKAKTARKPKAKKEAAAAPAQA